MPKLFNYDNLVARVTPATLGCEHCLRTGGGWVSLRLCLSCGQVACCDDSPRRHARAHFAETGHPLVERFPSGPALASPE